jgi:MoxR-like ATPase
MSESRSCRTCPSYLAKSEVSGMFGKSIGAPMCARLGKVLGGPDILPVAEEKLQSTIAENCSAYGQPRPVSPQGYLQTEVTLPHPVAVAAGPSSEDERQYVNSCNNCKFHIPENEVMEKHGWAAGLCAATGRIIIPGRQSREAKDCEYRTYGAWQDDVDKMHVIPMYAEAKAYDPSPLGRWKLAREKGLVIDPREYPSDADVSDQDRASGIRAWRRVEDPNGTGNSTFLPIFEPSFFDPFEQAKIPQTGDPEHPEDYIDSKDYVYSVAIEWQELDATPALWGPPGVGKTELGRHLAWLMQVPFDRISFTREMEVEDVIGKMVLLGGETVYQKGRVPLRWEKPGICLLDEPNTAPDAVWQRLRPMMDNSKQLVLDEAAAEVVDRHPHSFLLLAMNPAWDTRNVGVAELADADVDRAAHIFMDLPPENVEREILKSAVARDGWELDAAMLDRVMKTSSEVRALVADGSLPVSWGVRPNLKVVRHLKWFDPITAYRRAVADVLEPVTQELILGLVRTGWEVE